MKFLVVDDHALIRDAMQAVLQQQQPGAEVLCAVTAAEARAVVVQHADLDLALLDLQLPDSDGLELLAEWRDERPTMAVVVLSGSNDPAAVRAALICGASGFISKSDSREVLVRALALVMAGGVYVPSFALNSLAAAAPPAGSSAAPGAPSPESLGLTARQLEVLALMLEGRSNKLIARELNLAEATVKNHVTALLRALSVVSRTEAVVVVTAWGWVMPRPRAHRSTGA